MKNLIFIIIFSIYFFNVRFKNLPPGAILATVLLIVPLILKIKNIKLPYSKRANPAFLILILITIISIISFLNSNMDEFFGFQLTTYLWISSIVIPTIIYNLFQKDEDVLKLLIGCGILNSIFIILMFISPGFKEIYNGLLETPTILDGVDQENSINLRNIGLSGFASYSTGVLQMIFSFIFLLHKKLKGDHLFVKDLFLLILFIISGMLAARSSIIGVVFAMFMLFIFFGILPLIKLFFLLSTSALIFLCMIYLLLPENLSNFFITWLSEPFTSGLKTASLQVNKEMFNIDYTMFSLLGEFRWFDDNSRSNYFMHTDVGYLRILLALGYIGLFLFLILNIYLALPIRNEYSVFRFFTMLYLILILFKGSIISDAFQIYTLIFTSIILEIKQINKYHEKKFNDQPC
ncbi:hypothetical protein [Comamonas aquatica]|uniref:hypothetical protein n=1 Tax=Comamonas aquatica TaxID=225991 RepID=UPI0021B14CC3|nr:hypothetical protein [Comamonas aquatica]